MPTISSAASPQTLRDVEYARIGDVSLRFDASLPRAAHKSPAVIIVHGGGWVAGDRSAGVQPLFQPLSNAGFAWFSISYRLVRNAMEFGVGLEDVETAIKFVKAHADEYGIDPERIALVGESAGGQLAAMAALREKPGTSVRAVVGLYAPTDLVSLAKNSDYIPQSIRNSINGKPWQALVLAGLAQLSPISNVHKGMPAFLLIHGTDDALVPFSQSVEMCNRMRGVGGSCEVFPVVGGGHGMRWWEAYPKLAAPYKQKMVEWLKHQLSPAGSVS